MRIRNSFRAENSLLSAEDHFTQTMTHLGRLGYLRILGAFATNFDCNVFPVLYLSVLRKQKKIVTVHRF